MEAARSWLGRAGLAAGRIEVVVVKHRFRSTKCLFVLVTTTAELFERPRVRGIANQVVLFVRVGD
jgi:hypothetical protein